MTPQWAAIGGMFAALIVCYVVFPNVALPMSIALLLILGGWAYRNDKLKL